MRKRKLTLEQHKRVAERNLLYMRLRLEAAKHSLPTMAREYGVAIETMRAYINRKPS